MLFPQPAGLTTDMDDALAGNNSTIIHKGSFGTFSKSSWFELEVGPI